MQVKQLELSEKAQLLSFFKEVHPHNPRLSDERFWEWHYPHNPYVEPANLPAWIVTDAGKIVGHLGAIPVRLKIGEAEKTAIWAVDLIVHSDYRRKGLARKLVIAAEKYCPRMLAINTVKQHSTALFESLDWQMVGKIPRYNKLLYPGEAVREIARFKILRRLANTAFVPFRPRRVRNFYDVNNLRIIEKFDSSFDQLWRESAALWTCSVVREAAILKWQYENQPNKKFEILGYYENEKLRGYAVLYFRRADANGAVSKAAITDLYYHPANASATVDALLKGAVQLTLERRAGALVIDVKDDLIEARLRFNGFSRVKNPLQLLVKLPEQQAVAYDLDCWLVTRGDSDASIFEEPNLI